MTAAEELYREGRTAVLQRAEAVIDGGATGDEVAVYRRRRLFQPAPTAALRANLPDTKLGAIRRAAGLATANAVVLDAAEANDPEMLEAVVELEEEVHRLPAREALTRFETSSTDLFDRLVASRDLVVETVYPVTHTAAGLTVFIATEMHLQARMLDPTYEPSNARTLAHELNQALRPVLGSGLENWLTERVTPWRNMVIRRGLAWP